MNRTMEKEKRYLGELTMHMRELYNKSPNRAGHDFTHIARGMKNCEIICEGTNTSSFLAKTAFLLHDLNRALKVNDAFIARFIDDTLRPYPYSRQEIDLIVDAVLKHGEINKEDDSELLMIVKDADRLDALGALGITRICQHRHYLDPYNPSDPFRHGSTKEEDLNTLVDDFYRCLEWVDDEWLRMPKAIELGKRKGKVVREFLKEMEFELKQLGLLD